MKIGWILSGNEVDPGARILGFNIHRELRRRGHESEILHAPAKYSVSLAVDAVDVAELKSRGFTTIVFQKVFDGFAEQIARDCVLAGMRTIYLASECCGANMVRVCNGCGAVSLFLKNTFPRQFRAKIEVVKDALEVPPGKAKKLWKSEGKLKAVYVGSAFPSDVVRGMMRWLEPECEVTVLSSGYRHSDDVVEQIRYRRSVGQRLRSLTRLSPFDNVAKIIRQLSYSLYSTRQKRWLAGAGSEAFCQKPWSADTVWDDILAHDIAIIPCELNSDYHMSKSANRLTMFMAMGVPVVASPVPSYRTILKNGRNGYLARTPSEWRRAVRSLQDEAARERIGRRAQSDVVDKFSLSSVADEYMKLLL